MVFQNPDNQIVGNTLAEDIGFRAGESSRVSSEDIWKKIDEMLELTGLTAYKYANTSRIIAVDRNGGLQSHRQWR